MRAYPRRAFALSRPLVVAALIALVALLLRPGSAAAFPAALVSVPCGDASALVAAIASANSGGGTVELGAACTYTLTAASTSAGNGLPAITGGLDISGNGSTIERSGAAGTPTFRILEIAEGGALTLRDVTVAGGSSTEGGGILDAGTLTMDGGSLRGNQVEVPDQEGAPGGGALADAHEATLDGVTVEADTATSAQGVAEAGGVDALYQSTLTLDHVTFKNDRSQAAADSAIAGALSLAVDSKVTVDQSTFDDNQATSSHGVAAGGAIADGGALTVHDSSFDDNTASALANTARGGAISDTGAVPSLQRDRFVDNNVSGQGALGGAIWGNQLDLADTVVDDNKVLNTGSSTTARGGGIYVVGGRSQVSGGEITGNRANGPGASGGGIWVFAGAHVTLSGTTVPSNVPNQCRPIGSTTGC